MLNSAPRFLTYEAGDSRLHTLDPRTKLAGAALLVADVLMSSVPRGIVVAYMLGALAGLAAIELLPAMWRLIRPLLIFLLLLAVLVIVTTPGHALAHFLFIVPTTDGFALAIRLDLQVLLIAYTSSLVTLTTPPLAIASGLQWLLGWLERIRVPVRDIIAMVTIGLTFVPLLISEAQRIIAAQRARGADLTMAALADEESLGALLIPLLLGNLRRGDELAESLEARLYDTGPRTSLEEYHFHRADAVVAGILLVGSVIVAVLSFGPLSG